MQLLPEEQQERALAADQLLVDFYDKRESVASVRLSSLGWIDRTKLRPKLCYAQTLWGGLSGSIVRAKKPLGDSLVSARIIRSNKILGA